MDTAASVILAATAGRTSRFRPVTSRRGWRLAVRIADTIDLLGVQRFDLAYAPGRVSHRLRMRTIELFGREVIPRVLEPVATMAGAQRIIDAAVSRWGRVDGLVCSAGILRPSSFLDMSEQDWDDVVATHLKGHFAMMQTAARAMVKQGTGGSLVAMGSGYLSPTPHLANYRAAKAGVLALTKTAALDLADTGIRANCVSLAATPG